jgi:CheY-like chemotaxis protein
LDRREAGTRTPITVKNASLHTTDILRELGYEVFEATEGDTGLSLVASQPRIKLLFTDVGLPGPFNNRQIADEARKLRSDLKVLFTTTLRMRSYIRVGLIREFSLL